MSSHKHCRARLSLIDRALIEQAWHSNAVRAQIHALMGDDSDQFVNAAGKVFFVVLGAAIREDVDPEMPEIRILRGACNALYDQAGEPAIDASRRASIRVGLEACEQLIPALPRRALIDAACELTLKLRNGDVRWHDFEKALEAVTA